MEKIELKTGQEFQVKNVSQTNDKLSFMVIGVDDFTTFRESLTKKALSDIKVSTGKTLTGVYEKFNSLQPFTMTEENGKMNITVTLKQESGLEAKIDVLENTIDAIILSSLGGVANMSDTIRKLYQEGKIDEVGIDIAVNKQWITEPEKQMIISRE